MSVNNQLCKSVGLYRWLVVNLHSGKQSPLFALYLENGSWHDELFWIQLVDHFTLNNFGHDFKSHQDRRRRDIKKISICVIFDLYISWRGHGMSSLQTHSNCSVLQLTVSNAVHNPLFDVIRWLEGKWGRVSLLCVVTPMSQDKVGHVALCWAPASSNRLILLLYPVPIPFDSLVSKKFLPIRWLAENSFRFVG